MAAQLDRLKKIELYCIVEEFEAYMSGKAETKSNLVSAEKMMEKSEFFSGETCFGHRLVSGFQGKFSAETSFARNWFRPFISRVSGVWPETVSPETSFGRNLFGRN